MMIISLHRLLQKIYILIQKKDRKSYLDFIRYLLLTIIVYLNTYRRLFIKDSLAPIKILIWFC